MELARFLETVSGLSVTYTVGRNATVFSALRLGDDELWHSDLLAWFLDPFGPLTGGWFLRFILEHVGCDLPVEGACVSREVQCGSEILDILIEWPGFRLLIENKTKSGEHSDQCKRYLETFDVINKDHGRLIFLSPMLDPWPKSVDRSDSRVIGLSYRDVATIMRTGLQFEPSSRARLFVEEYLKEVDKMTGNLSIKNECPTVSKETKLLVAKWSILSQMRDQAIEESTAYLEWSLGQVLAKVNKLNMGVWATHNPFGSTLFFTREEWNLNGHLYGIAYSAEAIIGTRLLHEYPHIVGVRMEAVADQQLSKQEFRETVRQAIYANWNADIAQELGINQVADKAIRSNQSMWPVYKPVPVRDPANWDTWTQELCDTVTGFACAFCSALSDVSEHIQGQSAV